MKEKFEAIADERGLVDASKIAFILKSSGIDLGEVRVRILAENLAYNSSLYEIHMVRK